MSLLTMIALISLSPSILKLSCARTVTHATNTFEAMSSAVTCAVRRIICWSRSDSSPHGRKMPELLEIVARRAQRVVVVSEALVPRDPASPDDARLQVCNHRVDFGRAQLPGGRV